MSKMVFVYIIKNFWYILNLYLIYINCSLVILQSEASEVDAAVIEMVMEAVETMVQWTMSNVRKGLNWDDYSSATFMNLIGSCLSAVSLLPSETDFQKQKALELTKMMENMMAALVSTQVESEDPISIENSKFLITGRRTRTATKEAQGAGSLIFLDSNLLAEVLSTNDEFLQIMSIIDQNPFTGANDVNTVIPSLNFKSALTTNDIVIKDLPDKKRVRMYIFPNKEKSFPIENETSYMSTGYNPQQGLQHTNISLKAKESKKIVLKEETKFAKHSSLHIQILVTINETETDSDTEINSKAVTAYLGVNYEATKDRFKEKMDLFGNSKNGIDHRTYTFFISDQYV